MHNLDTITQNAMRLNATERNQLFAMITDNVEILIKLLPNAPLLEYITTGEKSGNLPIFQAYDQWKFNS